MQKLALILVGILFSFIGVVQAEPQHPEFTNLQIVINLPSRELELYSATKLLKTYPVAIGKAASPTPLGNFKITEKVVNPAWYPPSRPGVVVPSGPNNPLGYRWLGFYPMYGIHGTNSPPSIGQIISNGCVRMYEPDVEELYKIVGYNTPVRIVYERFKAGWDDKNRAFMAVYPDVYGRQHLSLQAVREKITPLGWSQWLTDTELLTVMKRSTQQVLPQFARLLCNGAYKSTPVFIRDTGLLVPVTSIADTVNALVKWDEVNQMAVVGEHAVPGVRKGEAIYVAPETVPLLFGGTQVFNSEDNQLEVEVLSLTLNGNHIAGIFPQLAKRPLLPVLELAALLGESVVWDEAEAALWHNNRQVTIQLINGRPYLPINQIYQQFNAYVYWDEEARIIDITFPFQEPDY